MHRARCRTARPMWRGKLSPPRGALRSARGSLFPSGPRPSEGVPQSMLAQLIVRKVTNSRERTSSGGGLSPEQDREPSVCEVSARSPELLPRERCGRLLRQIDERVAADVDHDPLDRASGERPRSLAGVVVGYRLGPRATEDQAAAAQAELARLGSDRCPTRRPCPGCGE